MRSREEGRGAEEGRRTRSACKEETVQHVGVDIQEEHRGALGDVSEACACVFCGGEDARAQRDRHGYVVRREQVPRATPTHERISSECGRRGRARRGDALQRRSRTGRGRVSSRRRAAEETHGEERPTTAAILHTHTRAHLEQHRDELIRGLLKEVRKARVGNVQGDGGLLLGGVARRRATAATARTAAAAGTAVVSRRGSVQ
jgi:hypothetical protein